MNKNGMDKECIELCEAMNLFHNIQTVESCCGHGKNHGNIALADGKYINIHNTRAKWEAAENKLKSKKQTTSLNGLIHMYNIMRLHNNGKIKACLKAVYSKLLKTGIHTNPKYWL